MEEEAGTSQMSATGSIGAICLDDGALQRYARTRNSPKSVGSLVSDTKVVAIARASAAQDEEEVEAGDDDGDDDDDAGLVEESSLSAVVSGNRGCFAGLLPPVGALCRARFPSTTVVDSLMEGSALTRRV